VLNSKLSNSSLTKLSRSGFLIGDYNADEFRKDLAEIFLVAVGNRDIAGYIVLSKRKEYINNKYKVWSFDSAKSLYYSEQGIELKTIIVRDKFRRTGLAKKLLTRALRISDQKFQAMFSVISLAPVPNYASLNFHLKNGFKVVSISQPRELFGITNYQSMLLMKNLG